MQNTTNYGFKKPGGGDIVDINDLNTNADLMDEALTPAATPTQVPTSNGPGKLSDWVSWIANRIKNITGKTNWYDAPDITLASTKAHVDAAAPHTGHVLTSDVVTVAAANKILKLDASGKLPADITGDANTLDGKHASDFAAAGHFAVSTGSLSHGAVIPQTPAGYSNYAYFVSLRTLDIPSVSTSVSLPGGSSVAGGTYTVSDIDMTYFECYADASRVVHATGQLTNGTWFNGTVNYMVIAWN